jgi:hypothetical protein
MIINYSIQVGENLNSIFLKKNREIKTKSRWYGLTPFSYVIDLVIFEEAEVTSSFHFHLRVLIYFHAFLRP